MDLFEAISKRRSVRKFSGEKVPNRILEKIVNAGRFAPSGYNRQPWEFIIITGHDSIERMKIAARWMEKAAAIIAVVLDPGASKYWLEDGSAAIENLLLATTALGYGACWVQGNIEPFEDDFKTLLDIPTEKKLLALIPIGVPVDLPTIEKKPLNKIVHWEKYQKPG